MSPIVTIQDREMASCVQGLYGMQESLAEILRCEAEAGQWLGEEHVTQLRDAVTQTLERLAVKFCHPTGIGWGHALEHTKEGYYRLLTFDLQDRDPEKTVEETQLAVASESPEPEKQENIKDVQVHEQAHDDVSPGGDGVTDEEVAYIRAEVYRTLHPVRSLFGGDDGICEFFMSLGILSLGALFVFLYFMYFR